MKIEQTDAFIITLDHAVNFAKDYMYCTEWEEMREEFISGQARMRSPEFIKKLEAKANQKLKRKAY